MRVVQSEKEKKEKKERKRKRKKGTKMIKRVIECMLASVLSLYRGILIIGERVCVRVFRHQKNVQVLFDQG